MVLSEELNNKSWYLIYSKPKKEKTAQEHLERQGYEAYLPLIRNERRHRSKCISIIEPLFSRYLFVRLDKIADNWLPIHSTIGVAKIVEFGHIPAQVPDHLVSTLMKNENENEAGIQCLPVCEYKSGEAVRVIKGAIKGYEGIFMAETSQERVIILLNMLGEQSKLTIPLRRGCN